MTNRYGLKQCLRCKGDLYTYNYKKVPFSCVQCGHQFYLVHGKFVAMRKEAKVDLELGNKVESVETVLHLSPKSTVGQQAGLFTVVNL